MKSIRRWRARLKRWWLHEPPGGGGQVHEPNTWSHHRARAQSEGARNQNWNP